MDKVTVISADSGDAWVIQDLLRVYYPKITPVKTKQNSGELPQYSVRTMKNVIEGQEKIKKTVSENRQVSFLINNNQSIAYSVDDNHDRKIKEILFYIEKKDFPEEVKVTLLVEGHVYCQVERLQEEIFREEKVHRLRRLLRLALHKVIVKALPIEPSPWGILTRVRPTKIVHRFLDEGLTEERILTHLTRDFAISSERARLLTRVAVLQHPLLPNKREARKLMSLYIGIPFCPTRCHYCSFPAYPLDKWGQKLTDYLLGLCREIKVVGESLREAEIIVQTVYLGGGTPTILSAAQLDRLLKTVEDTFQFVADKEITVEGGRPETITFEKLRILQKHGVTRLSINPQTMCEETLVSIGRKHTVQEVLNAYQLTREVGIPVINMDLIVGLPGENSAILRKTIEEVLKLAPENITLHALAMKRAAYYRQEKIDLSVPTEGQAMMDLAHHCLQAAGFFPYYLYRQKESFAHGENVGYTVLGKPCLYNIQMMEERQSILGFGVGSGSKLVRTEDWTLENIYNPKDLSFYLERLEEIITKKIYRLKEVILRC